MVYLYWHVYMPLNCGSILLAVPINIQFDFIHLFCPNLENCKVSEIIFKLLENELETL